MSVLSFLNTNLTQSDFDYALPEALIAQYPLANRTDSRLLILNHQDKTIRDGLFKNILELISPKDLLIFNQTRVMNARLFGVKPTGGKVELLIERVLSDHQYALAHIKSSKGLKPGNIVFIQTAQGVLEGSAQDVKISKEINIEILEKSTNGLVKIKLLNNLKNNLKNNLNFYEILKNFGHVPLPPYIHRQDENLDTERYQTVFSKIEGSVAAPTAGLHFDLEILERLKNKGVEMAHILLHVGAGTFQPVRVENLSDHVMHSEWVEVNSAVVDQVKKTKAQGGKVIAVGTTTVRALESAAMYHQVACFEDLKPYQGETDIFIKPGFKFKIIDKLITNFHLPKSTLLMLVSAMAGREFMLEAYHYAVANQYRFFSYGDAMWIE